MEKHLYEKQKKKNGLELDIVFYDVTTYYFESQKADELRDFGFSKDISRFYLRKEDDVNMFFAPKVRYMGDDGAGHTEDIHLLEEEIELLAIDGVVVFPKYDEEV